MSTNPLINQVMGRRPLGEDVPVPCAALSRRSYRDRMIKNRQRDPEQLKREDESLDNVRSVIGEAKGADDELIPADAEDLETSGSTMTAKLRPIKDVVQEPSYPSAEKEKFLTPYAALTAPDATPDAMSPIDPSKVPGAATQAKFTWGELEKAGTTPSAPPPESANGSDVAVNAMDVLLGRNRAAKPAKTADEMVANNSVATESQAMSMLGIENPMIAEDAVAKAAAALVANSDPTGASLMPEHKAADSRKVCDVARKWF